MEGRRRLAAGDTAAAVDELTGALAFWRGPAYADVAGAEYALGEAARLSELRWVATEDFAEAQVERGSFELASADLSRLVQDQPGRERAWGLLIRASTPPDVNATPWPPTSRPGGCSWRSSVSSPGRSCALERRVLEQDPELSIRRAPPSRRPCAAKRTLSSVATRRWPGSARRGASPVPGRDSCGCSWGRSSRAAPVWRPSSPPSWSPTAVRSSTPAARTGSPARRGSTFPTGSRRDRLSTVSSSTAGAPRSRGPRRREWSSSATIAATGALASVIPQMSVMLLVIADPSGSGAALQGVVRLDDTGVCTVDVGAMDDELLAALVVADGVGVEGRVRSWR